METEQRPKQDYGPGNPEFKQGERVRDKLFKKKGTVEAIKSGLRIGSRETYDVMFDEPLTLDGSDRLHSFDYDQITKLEE